MSFLMKIWKRFRGIWETPKYISQKVARGTILNFSEKIVTKSVLFVRTIILARILFPGDFGLFSMATIALAASGSILQTGFNQALVYEKSSSRRILDTAWTFNVLRGFLISLVVFFIAAPLAGNFFNNPGIILFVRALAILALLDGLENIGVLLFDKELQYNKKFWFNTISTTLRVVVVILAALILRNAWALVIGAIAGRVFFLVLSYIIHPYRPRLTIDWFVVRRLFKYGKWIFVSGVITFLVSRGDAAVIGRLLDPSSLGFYHLALGLGLMPAVEIVKTLSGLLFPLYSKIRGDYARMKNVFIRVSRVVFLIILPASLGLIAIGKDAVGLIYGPKWLPMVPILYVVVIYGLIKAFELISKPLFMGIGKPKIPTIITIIQVIVIFSFLVPLINMYGAVGAAMAITLGMLVSQVIFLFRLKKEINLGFKSILGSIYLPLISSTGMFLAIFALKKFISISNLGLLIGYMIFGVVVYSFFVIILDKIFGHQIKRSYLWIKENL